MKKFEFLEVYAQVASGFFPGVYVVTQVEGKSLSTRVPWREYRDARGQEGYSLAGFVVEQNFGANAGFLATFQREVVVEQDM